jgi:3-hydroxybutyrate dehydrogenase
MLNGFGPAKEIEEIREGLERVSGAKALHHPADMSKPAEIAKLIAAADAKLGGVDVLVNNAGIQHVAPLEDFPPEKWDAVLAVNLSSSFHAIRAALPVMRRRGWGRVINIASSHGLTASVGKAAYVAAKHGLIGLTKVTALETAQEPVTCNAICPGWVLTPLVQKQIDALAAREKLSADAARRKLLAEKQPSGEFATPEQIGGLAVFLCSPAADQIRGASLSIDGGWTAQ